jgi:hypothetical protein
MGAAMAQRPIAVTVEAQDHLGGGASQLGSSAVRILQPRADQVVTHNFVNLKFELVRPNPAGGNSNFILRLDARDPVNTSSTEYTFTEVRDGAHVITVIEVDANGTPLPDSSAEVHFTVKATAGGTDSEESGQSALSIKK